MAGNNENWYVRFDAAGRRLPNSEDDCSRICGYDYIPENRFSSRELLRDQEVYVTRNYDIVGRHPPPCQCTVTNNRKCAGSECINRRLRIACSPDCGPYCQNNPWAHNGFALGQRTYVDVVRFGNEQGHGIFASDVIHRHDFICEYTGVVVPDVNNLDARAHDYAFQFDFINQYLDSYGQGSGARLCNRSCRPNMRSVQYVHDQKVKIVYKAMRTIRYGEQLTLDYNWEYDTRAEIPECLCQMPGCTGLMGKLSKSKKSVKTRTNKKSKDTAKKSKNTARKRCNRKTPPEQGSRQPVDNDDTEMSQAIAIPDPRHDNEEIIDEDADQDDPQEEFPSVVDNAPAEVLRLFNLDPIPEERPEGYIENHNFTPLSPVFVILEADGILQLSAGRVVRCYRNAYGLVIFIVRIARPGQVDLHIPQYICFHFMEDGIFRLVQNVFSREDRDRIANYTRNGATGRAAANMQDQLVPDYLERFQLGDIPRSILASRTTQGPIAIGLPTHRLLLVPNEQQSRNNEFGLPTISSRNKKPTAQQKHPLPLTPGRQRNTSFHHHAPTPSSSSSSTSSNEDQLPERRRERRPRSRGNSGYSSIVRQNMDDIVQRLAAPVNFHRVFEHAVETVTIMAYSRFTGNVNYNDLLNRVRAVLDYYYNLALPHQRRFLLYTDYRLATEAADGGSWNINWCSLCGENETFRNDREQQRHFRRRHSICATKYICPGGCGMSTSLPSVLRTHAPTCGDVEFSTSLRSNLESQILDAFADYIASMDRANHQLHVFPPGLPNLRSNESGPGKSHAKGAKSCRSKSIKMDLKTRQPVDRNVAMKAAKFSQQKTYATLKNWGQLRYGESQAQDPDQAPDAAPSSEPRIPGLVEDDQRPGPSRHMYRNVAPSSSSAPAARARAHSPKRTSKKRSRSVRRREDRESNQPPSDDDNSENVRKTRSRTKMVAAKSVPKSKSKSRSSSKKGACSGSDNEFRPSESLEGIKHGDIFGSDSSDPEYQVSNEDEEEEDSDSD